jgi:hypothetical protein
LQICRRHIHALEEQNQVLVDNERKLNSRVQALELERTALLDAVAALRQNAAVAAALPSAGHDVLTCSLSADADSEVASLTVDRRRREAIETDTRGAPAKKCWAAKDVRLLVQPADVTGPDGDSRPASASY